MRKWIGALAIGCSMALTAQEPFQPSTINVDSWQEMRAELDASSWFSGLPLREVGPRVMSGRVVDLDVRPGDGSEFYVAYATGGVYHTVNHGTSFTQVFDFAATTAVGAVAVDWESNIVYVGTGEVNSSRSSYAGTGIYRSSDHGAHWEHLGLEQTHHIGKIILHPTEPNTLWVAAAGPLYSKNTTGGIYKSTDGGAHWERMLGIDGTAGIDLVMDTENPNHLYASLWQRSRSAWNFVEGGEDSGLYETTDGGKDWSDLTQLGGLPDRQHLGRMGMAHDALSNVLYVLLDDQSPLPPEPHKGLIPSDFLGMSMRKFDKLDSTEVQDYFDEFGIEASRDSVADLIHSGAILPEALHDYVADGNRDLFNAGVVGASVYQLNEGKWSRTHAEPLESICYTYGYYFGLMERGLDGTLYIAGVPLLKSTDNGTTWQGIGAPNVHVDHHVLWSNPLRPNHLINGNDGGINISWDGGLNWIKCNSPAVAQCYAIEVDNEEPYNIYCGLQDNGVWMGPSDYSESLRWQSTGQYPWQELGGGDGMQIEIDPRNNEIAYFGSQFGWYQKLNRGSDERLDIHPKHQLGERPLRWNWQTPIWISRHAPDTVYMGANRVFQSVDAGVSWEPISEDLTGGGRSGNVPFGTLTSLHESPLQRGRIAVGSDDGRVHFSEDTGKTWTPMDLPMLWSENTPWISEVLWSEHVADRVFVALNTYRWDHFQSYIFQSDDLGQTWQAIHHGLPAEPVNALCEIADQPDLLIAGTDGGGYARRASLGEWSSLHTELPHAPVHDLVYQKSARELVIGTHGRSVWVLSMNVLTEQPIDAGEVILLPADTTSFTDDWSPKGWAWGTKTPQIAQAWCFLPEHGDWVLNVSDSQQELLVSLPLNDRQKGWQRLELPLEQGDLSWEIGAYVWALISKDGLKSDEAAWVIADQ